MTKMIIDDTNNFTTKMLEYLNKHADNKLKINEEIKLEDSDIEELD